MKRRSKAGGKASKARGREASKTKRRDASKTASSSAPIQDAEVARLTRELNGAREQQTATSEVLRLLSGSHGDLNHLFDTILVNATNLCHANFGTMALYEGDALRIVAMHNVPAAFAELRRREPVFHAGPLSPPARITATKKVLHISDLSEDAAYKQREPIVVGFVELAGARTMLVVPMLKEKHLVGVIGIYRKEVRPFTDKQIELVQNFAAQAVIATENARLLNELRQSTTQLTEALGQQTATSEVLQTISQSPGELQPVFHTMLANAVQICDAKFGNLLLFEDGAFRTVALHGAPQPYLEARQREPVIQPKPGSDLDQLIKTKQVIHVPDVREKGMASGTAIIKLAGARTMLNVPMLKENELIGAIGIYRQEVRQFTDKQIELVKNFAAQAVIAIENARLLNELRQRTTDLTERTADLTEALEQQTATSRSSKSSVARLVTCSRCLQPFWRRLFASATRRLVTSTAGTARLCIWLRRAIHHQLLRKREDDHYAVVMAETRCSPLSWRPKRLFTSSMLRRYLGTLTEAIWRLLKQLSLVAFARF